MDGVAAIPYDYLVLALGAVANFYHTPGADQYAFPLYTMEDAIRLKITSSKPLKRWTRIRRSSMTGR
jgi:NADH dehydrogenase, FAD-containing subunit